MKTKLISALILICFSLSLYAVQNKENTPGTMKKNIYIESTLAESVAKSIIGTVGEKSRFRVERGVAQVAGLWRKEDGTPEEFKAFCKTGFITDDAQLDTLFLKLQRNLEIISGYFHKIDLQLKEPVQLTGSEITPLDELFGGYDISSHLDEDLFANKIAFIAALNFPYYSLEEKTKEGKQWTRKQWAYARMGDRFTIRIPANVLQNLSQVLASADSYISGYNICMGSLQNAKGEKLFPADMKLISHWGLRDELKSDYSDKKHGKEKQELIYSVMKRIIDQSIPADAINSDKYTWNPVTNDLYSAGKQVTVKPEDNKRYEMLLASFRANKDLDAYTPQLPNALARNFDGNMEILQQDVETLFKGLLTSPEVKRVAALIQKKVGRNLRPYDIWYNGFKSKPDLSEAELNQITSKKYPNPKALETDLPEILIKLGWSSEKAKQIASLVKVDPARGSGHATGAVMKNDYAHLRTRIAATGMDYKGYNIAVHEFGHNTEQTITMNDVDYWMLSGVPNTAFTEAVAFMFQKRDLELLGFTNTNADTENNLALDDFWSCYEIMGVALLDIATWEWMYAHPNATPQELKEAVLSKSKEIWNTYYAGVLGGKDETILAIYSHMIDAPLYLSNYPIGYLISFQVEGRMKGKSMADEMQRMYTQGRIIPQIWMNNSVGKDISAEPLLEAVRTALKQ
ncbi:MAG: hypothetical protein PHT07_09535 [Paludibacter sp.]|nr:hypothetical protein [Paludibacter sp.]